MRYLALLFSIIGLLLLPSSAHASGFDIWGIEIQATQTGPFSVDAEIIVYVKRNVPGDNFRDSLNLSWGDGTFSRLAIANNADNDGDGVPDGTILEERFTKYSYAGAHVYATQDRYLLSVENPNRDHGIMNVNFPNSVSVPLYTESEILLVEDFENNRLPLLLEPPIHYAFVSRPYRHIPNAFDVNDDSLVYELVVPKQGVDDPVPNYYGVGTLATIDPETGIFSALIEQPGIFTFAIQVSSYRDGQLVGRVVRDMKFYVQQIAVPDNQWPAITLNTPTVIIQEVSVDDTVRFTANVEDDFTAEPLITTTSGLYDFYTAAAEFDITDNAVDFQWIVTEEHIRTQPYPVVIKARDDYQELGYTNLILIRYRVSNGPTSVAEIAEDIALHVFPNPANNELTLTLPSSIDSSELAYRLFSSNGQQVKSGRVSGVSTVIRIADLPAGGYLCQISLGNRVLETRQVVIQ